jgi:hypothetical protein
MMALLFCFALWPQEVVWKASVVEDKPSEKVPEVWRKALDAKAMRVVDGDDNPRLNVWLRSSIPAQATPEQIQNGLTYREITEGTAIGVIELTKPFTDYRKQELPAGIYSLRLGYQPEIGDHQGTAPHPDFLLLIPIEDDMSLEVLEAKTLQKLSRKVTGSDHPAVMLLFPNSAKNAEPKIVAKPGNVQIFNFVAKLKCDDTPVSLGFGLTVSGVSKSR